MSFNTGGTLVGCLACMHGAAGASWARLSGHVAQKVSIKSLFFV